VEVKLARTAGFCMGVRLAMDKALALAAQGRGPVYTLGPLIHNPQAIGMLEAHGVRELKGAPDALPGADSGRPGTVVIRAHGVPEQVKDQLRARGLEVVDGTCPHVLAAQRHIARHAAEGYTIVIAGDKDHAEVEGLRSHAGGRCIVVSTVEEAQAAEVVEPACLVAQTTFNEETYELIAAALRRRLARLEVVQTICRATRDRQEETLRLAHDPEVEAMVVVGGLHSANTRRLAELSRAAGKPTFHVETAADLDPQALWGFRVVGLTAGASTPNWVTHAVLQALEDIHRPAPLAQALGWRALAALTRSNVFSAAAAVALTYAAAQLLGIRDPSPVFLLSAFCYVFAVTTLNRLALGDAPERLLPPRVAFYHRHARPLAAASALFALGSLSSLVLMGNWLATALMALGYALGVAYAVRLVPARLSRLVRFARLKDLPASKDLFVALGYLVVCVLVPWLSQGGRGRPALAIAAAFAFILTFLKANVVDMGDMEQDRLLGRETLPILLGSARTRRLLTALAVVLAIVLAAGAALGWTPSLAWLLLACPASLIVYLWHRHDFPTAPDVVAALAADGAMLLAGLLALGWRALALG